MKRARRKSEPVDLAPRMPEAENPFEEKLIEKEFTLLFSQLSKMPPFSSFTEGSNFIFRHGYFAGKAAGKRESLGSPTEVITPPNDASVREMAGAIKEKRDGVTESD